MIIKPLSAGNSKQAGKNKGLWMAKTGENNQQLLNEAE